MRCFQIIFINNKNNFSEEDFNNDSFSSPYNKNNVSNISTGVDSLLDLLKEKKSLSLEEAAKILKVDESIVESWAKFLEESGDVSINYNLLTPFISLNEKKIEKKPSFLKKKLSNISYGFEVLYDKALNFLKLKDFNSLNDSLKILSREFNDSFKKIESNLSEEEKKEFEKDLNTFNSKINLAWNYYKKNNSLKSKIEYENALQQFYLLSEKLKDYLNELSKLKKNYASDFETLDSSNVFSSYESLVNQAKKLLEQGEVEKAKEVYDKLKRLYHEDLPKQFELQRESLKKNLFSLSKDLTFALDYEQKSRFEKGKKEIEDLLKKVSESLKNNDFDTVSKFMNYIISIFKKLPSGFEEEKKKLQEKIVSLNLKITNYKKKILDSVLKEELEEIESLRREFNKKIEEKNLLEAKKLYSLLKKRYLLLPSEILPEKVNVHLKLLDDFKKLSKLQKDLFLEDNNGKIKKCKSLIKKIEEYLYKNDIDSAENYYSILQDKIQEISDYFFENKALLQNESLKLYKSILDKSKDYYKELFERDYNTVLSLIEQGKSYVDKNNFELAEEAYVKALKLYSNLKPVFVDKKKELKNKLFELYKKIVLTKDLNIIEEKSLSVHEKYNELLNLIIDAHNKISSNHLDLFPSIVDKILLLKDSIPKNVFEKNKSILDEVKKLEEEKKIYVFSKKIDDMIFNNNMFDDKTLEKYVSSLLKYKNLLLKNNPEDYNLISYLDEVIKKLSYMKEKTIDSFVTIKSKKNLLEEDVSSKKVKKKDEDFKKNSLKRENNLKNSVKNNIKIDIDKNNDDKIVKSKVKSKGDFDKIHSKINKIKSILKS